MKVRLGNYIEEYSKKNKADEDIPVYSVTSTQGFCRDYFGKEVASKDKTTYKIVPQGCFAYNPSRINVGSVDWQRNEERVIVSPLYNVFSVSEELDQEYLYYYLKSDFALQRIRAVATGSVRDNLKLEMLKEFPILLPPKNDQKTIANNLDRVKRIIELRKSEIDKMNELIKARFVEMFGDLANPECSWDKSKLIDVCTDKDDIKCGPFGTQLNKDEYIESGIAVWEIPQINAAFLINPTHFLTEEKAEQLKAYTIIPGDIAMSRKGNVGKCALFPDNYPEGIIHSDVLRIRVDRKRINPLFMMCQLHFSGSVTRQIELVSSGAIMAGVNVTKLKQIYVHVPPIELQNQFADFVHQVDKSKVAVQKALEKTQLLFDSLMQQYFG
ncbi:restriction endonuclease subunit S [Blautia obeum]|nr:MULTISPECIES: restriction endonuclease subunit S [Blautia]MCB6731174.1 restriction endonuclease subunit S [Blautia obeum]MDE8678480.1 restriction endonuclease subunit S [Blautia schinkii]